MTTYSETHRILVEARRLLAEKGWCQEASALSSRGYAVTYGDPSAARYCLTGACRAAELQLNTTSLYAADDAIRMLTSNSGASCSLTLWNDSASRSKEDVLQLLDRTIRETP